MALQTPGYSRGELHAQTGVDVRTLDYWSNCGTLRASAGGDGKGRRRRFQPEEATLASILAQLNALGVTQKTLALFASMFHEALDWVAAMGLSGYELTAADLVAHRRKIEATGFSALPESGLIHHFGKAWTDKLPLVGPGRADSLSDPRRGLTWEQVPEYVKIFFPDVPDWLVEKCESLDLCEWDRFADYCIALSHDRGSNAHIEYLVVERDVEQNWILRFREPRDPDPISADACIVVNVANLKRQLRERP